ncbi:penicillin-binding protein activator [uncultured Ferrimonas sp.]|uniref:penicillin-binding protein activator n=1 Tax=uncultured Ferrimonas sp. TaxID=432640 RepID=UPI0026207578|nr:penicillin-binding protein activator [uncultured Ferrimonas sp.]
MKSLSVQTGRHALMALALCGLISCASAPAPKPTVSKPTVTLGFASETPAYYLQQAEGSQDQQRLAYLLLAARAYLDQNQPQLAQQLLERIGASIPESGTLAAEQRLLQAKLALLQGDRQQAQLLLQWPRSWSLPAAQWRDALAIEISLYQQSGDALNAAYGHYRLTQYLPQPLQQQNWDALWQALSPVGEAQLSEQLSQSRDPNWRGWLELGLIAQRYTMDPSTMLQQLAQWQQQNPSHPAARKLPAALERTINVQPYRPAKVAVLLPLSGRISQQARALQDGMLANLLDQDERRQVAFFDTDAIDAADAYQQALDRGAEFVIGPLRKQNVDKVLANYQGEVPLLALNQGLQTAAKPDLYFFALSPEAEAEQAAQRMQQQGLQRPLVLASGNAIGKRMAERFAKQWQELTDDSAEIHYFGAGQQMRGSVQQALHVDQSNARIKAIKQLFGPKTEADFRSRRDIDSLYLVANASEVRLLKPFVDVSLAVFADPLALYTSSRAHGDLRSDQQAAELQGLRLSDMPWLLRDNNQLQQATALWPNRSLAQQRLYAMGYDSWSLIDRLAQMRVFTGYRMRGLSGQLTVQPDGQLERGLEWSRYHKNGLKAD